MSTMDDLDITLAALLFTSPIKQIDLFYQPFKKQPLISQQVFGFFSVRKKS